VRRSEQEEKQRKNRQSTGKDQTDRAKHLDLDLCSSVLYHRSGQWLGLAPIFHGDIEGRSGCGLLLHASLVDHRAHIFQQHRHSLQLAFA
jgi:hypothetical protein